MPNDSPFVRNCGVFHPDLTIILDVERAWSPLFEIFHYLILLFFLFFFSPEIFYNANMEHANFSKFINNERERAKNISNWNIKREKIIFFLFPLEFYR